MPTYEYECARCGVMDIFQSIKDDALDRCPSCGSRRFRRLVSGGAGVIFKGDGFWETDYNRSEDYRKQAAAERGTGGTDGTGKDAGKGSTGGKDGAETGETGKRPVAQGTKAENEPVAPSTA